MLGLFHDILVKVDCYKDLNVEKRKCSFCFFFFGHSSSCKKKRLFFFSIVRTEYKCFLVYLSVKCMLK